MTPKLLPRKIGAVSVKQQALRRRSSFSSWIRQTTMSPDVVGSGRWADWWRERGLVLRLVIHLRNLGPFLSQLLQPLLLLTRRSGRWHRRSATLPMVLGEAKSTGNFSVPMSSRFRNSPGRTWDLRRNTSLPYHVPDFCNVVASSKPRSI